MNRRLQRGVQLIELALTLPILLLVVFAIIEYSVMLGALIVMNNTANEAARQATVFRTGFNAGDYQTLALDRLTNNLPNFVGDFRTNVQPTVQPFACGDATCLRLRLEYPNYAGNPLVVPGSFLPLPVALVAESVTRVEPNAN